MMRADELVGILNVLIARHGNLEVFVAGEMGWDDIDAVMVEPVELGDSVPWNAGDDLPTNPKPRTESLGIGQLFVGIV